ncbi:MAG TPA: alpha/beta fold hydrolase, partial [Gemmatimonadaceae bacterium]|nr:alpha/beta fold hydrolase [Gemmatimonadaceae bacterium]
SSTSYYFKEIEHYIFAGDTALHVAAAAYRTDIAKELVRHGADLSARNRRGAEPIHYAATGQPASARWDPRAQAAIVAYLLRAGSDPNAADKSGVTPLHIAVRTRCAAAARVLLANGADPRRKNGSGSTPLHLAVQNTGRGGSGTAAAVEQQREIIRLLVDHGARPGDTDSRGKTVTESIRDRKLSRSAFVLTIAVVAFVCSALQGCSTSGSNAVIASHQSSSRKSQLLRVPSKDGTLIAVECAGAGPTLILVHGGIGDRTRWTPMFPLLSSHFTVCAMDRRGHGLSGDSPDYNLQKEAEDVVAVVESQRGTVFVLGHSYGGVSALEAAVLTPRISKLILYEPPVQESVEHDLAVAGKMQRMINEGAREEAVVAFLTEVVHVSPSEVAAMKARPAWAQLVSTIDGQLRQMYALAAYRFDPARMVNVQAPTLLLLGGNTTSPYIKQAIDTLETSLPNAKRVVLQGQQHNAMDMGRDVLATAIITFLLGTPSR